MKILGAEIRTLPVGREEPTGKFLVAA